ncbi:ATP-binding protein [Novosphingobium soli]|uniref:ATP-binding protein n=1 Tax=Novosphingobium soli TaxID=574956 RepID=A0ABV6CRG4_9SPHN
MTFPTTIHATVGQSMIHKATRLFAGCVADALHEILQNARRGGASRVDICRLDQDQGTILRIRDDGRGIADPAKLLALGDSDWESDIARSEDPAGMGVFSLAGRHVVIRSRTADAEDGWQVTIPPQAWESGEPLDLVPAIVAKGTEIEIDLPKAWADELGQAVKNAARFYPLPVFYGDERQAHEGFLKEAVRVENWNGCRIGIFLDKHAPHREQARINFHGLTVPCRLPHVHDADGGRGWYAKVDIVDAPKLQFVLPARKEMVQNSALDALREACEAAIFRTIAREGHHRLSYAHWLRARELGVSLPEAAPVLHLWTPRIAETNDIFPGERIAGEPMVIMPTQSANIEQCVDRALKSGDGLGGSPVRAMPEFAGYGWYNALPRVLGLSFQVETDDETFHYDEGASVPEDLSSGRVGTIKLELAVRVTADSEEPADILALPADMLIVPTDCCSDLDDVAILLGTDCAITPNELASLLEASCFWPNEDCDADSHYTQQAAFEMQARFAANMLLLGEDAAVLERVREAMRQHVTWLIPKDRAISMHALNHLVEAVFADNDDASSMEASE